MTDSKKVDPPVAVIAVEVAPRAKPTTYPALFAPVMEGREKRPLGEVFGLRNFGVNLTHIAPGGLSALRHAHAKQDELIYVLSGTALLSTDAGDATLTPGMCAGFRAGTGVSHQLINQGQEEFVYLEVGDRSDGDHVTYPNDDLVALYNNGVWQYLRKDGTSYTNPR